ncbi:hypothetical protein ABBQ32_011573 [Trebouxia sp. C0010 RCD-2024]
MDRRSISMFLDEEEKRQRERRRSRDTRTGSTTPPIPEEPEDVPSDSGYMSGDSLSPPERQQHPAASIHRKHAPPSRPDTRTSTGFKEPPVSWHHDGPAIAVGGAQYPVASGSDSIVQEFHDALQRSPDTAVAVAAIKALTSVIRKSTARTMMGLEKELKDAAASLQSCNPTAISLKAGCELFLRYTTRTSAIENEDFATAKARIIERGKQFAETSTRARQTIAELGAGFVHHDAVVMVHGFSRVALALLHQVANNGVQFSVVVTEGRPDSTGLAMANALSKMKVPCTIVLDSGVAFALEALKWVTSRGPGWKLLQQSFVLLLSLFVLTLVVSSCHSVTLTAIVWAVAYEQLHSSDSPIAARAVGSCHLVQTAKGLSPSSQDVMSSCCPVGWSLLIFRLLICRIGFELVWCAE